ncbi:MAG: crossover junction endodeoxyribonuclease RuvC [Flavobacteriales bacterium]|nr:crossover junction endodeoxyribonuclease RuvC [Flavobacteriales bacterium]
MSSKDRMILGIDPGTVVMGYGVLHVTDSGLKVVALGVIKLDRFKDQATRLKVIFDRTTAIMREYCPDELAIEAPFFGKNVQSMLKLGRAQGVCIASALALNIPIVEYAPRRIKQSITGNGAASKEQVAAMLQSILKTSMEEFPMDATDALAAAVCHHFSAGRAGIPTAGAGGKKASGWAAFLKQNPDRKL